MKVTGKITKTECLLLVMTAVFLCVLAGLYLQRPEPVKERGYTMITTRETDETVTPEPSPPVDVNTAGLAELETLDGIGPVLAQRIIDYRQANGPFETPEDLLDVSGIGESVLADLLDSITLEEEKE